MTNRRPQVYAVMSTYRRPAVLRATLQRVARQRVAPDLLLLVDNCPSDEGRGALGDYERTGRRAEYMPMAENVGPAGAIAAAMREILRVAADDAWIWLLDDDDAPPDDDILGDLLTVAQARRGEEATLAAVGVRGARLDSRTGRLEPVTSAGGRVDYLHSGWFPLYSVGATRQVGVFDPELFYGFEELEYGLRLRREGYALEVWAPGRERLFQRVSRPSVRLRWDWRRYYSVRNRIHILRSTQRRRAAFRVSVEAGVLKPVLNAVVSPRTAPRAVTSSFLAVVDGWSGRLGCRVEPDGQLRGRRS